MKQIIALQEYSDKYISLYQGEIRNIETELANRLIEQGIVAEHGESEEESSNNNKNFIINLESRYDSGTSKFIYIKDKTFTEIENAINNNNNIIIKENQYSVTHPDDIARIKYWNINEYVPSVSIVFQYFYQRDGSLHTTGIIINSTDTIEILYDI